MRYVDTLDRELESHQKHPFVGRFHPFVGDTYTESQKGLFRGDKDSGELTHSTLQIAGTLLANCRHDSCK